MAVIPSDPEFRRMIKLAMQEKSPGLFEQLTESGSLDQVVDDRAELARQTHYELMAAKISELASNPNPDYLTHVANLDQATRESWVVASTQAFEFPQESLKTGSPGGTSSEQRKLVVEGSGRASSHANIWNAAIGAIPLILLPLAIYWGPTRSAAIALIALILLAGVVSLGGSFIRRRWGNETVGNIGVGLLLLWLVSGTLVGITQCSVRPTGWTDEEYSPCPGRPGSVC